jgi:hypothetical protein
MQLHLTFEELALLTQILQDEDHRSHSEVPSSRQVTSDDGLRDTLLIGRDLSYRTLSRNLQLGFDELEDLAGSLRRHQKQMTTNICRSEGSKSKSDLERKSAVLEHLLEKVTEACAML